MGLLYLLPVYRIIVRSSLFDCKVGYVHSNWGSLRFCCVHGFGSFSLSFSQFLSCLRELSAVVSSNLFQSVFSHIVTTSYQKIDLKRIISFVVLRKTDTTSGEEHEVNKTEAFLDTMRCNGVGRSTFRTKLLPVKLHSVTFQSSIAAVPSALGNSNFTL